MDLENVRGKSGFELSHMQVIEKTRIWMEHHKLMNKVIVIADHGSKQEGYYLENRDLALVFAGPNEKVTENAGVRNNIVSSCCRCAHQLVMFLLFFRQLVRQMM